MEALEEFIKVLEERNKRSLEQSKVYPDKSKRQKFRDFCGAYTDAIIEGKEILKKYKKNGLNNPNP